ncbi:MAG TPA: hypothetical protein VKD43_02700 [Xanthobacteraceae bacterium]|nr:hypothetical protein [Xanthobacteraceae bacterium]
MMRVKQPALALALIATVGAASAETERPKPGLQSPVIAAIRSIYQAVEQDIAAGRTKREQRSVEDCGQLGEQRTIHTDAAGRVRKYVVEGGSEDSALVVRQYYDVLGRVRFVFITGGAVNGAVLEHRIYFDESGARVREDHRYTKGPGYTFPSVWPEEELASDPRRSYDQSCSP